MMVWGVVIRRNSETESQFFCPADGSSFMGLTLATRSDSPLRLIEAL
jgi:hypothetical protein